MRIFPNPLLQIQKISELIGVPLVKVKSRIQSAQRTPIEIRKKLVNTTTGVKVTPGITFDAGSNQAVYNGYKREIYDSKTRDEIIYPFLVGAGLNKKDSEALINELGKIYDKNTRPIKSLDDVKNAFLETQKWETIRVPLVVPCATIRQFTNKRALVQHLSKHIPLCAEFKPLFKKPVLGE